MRTPTARNVAPAGSEYAETVRSNHCSCLQLERASQVNEGVYTLVATNSLGTNNYSIDAKFHKDEDLFAQTSKAAARVREIPGIFERVCQSIHQPYQVCIATGGGNFDQPLSVAYCLPNLHTTGKMSSSNFYNNEKNRCRKQEQRKNPADSKTSINSNLWSVKVFKGAILFLEATNDDRIPLLGDVTRR
ncbi:hypothetical protein TNCV_968371 [Trichonephila clavipes]|nr:hypothetical protein TNCV_968371 [Trichonephila clavipes]